MTEGGGLPPELHEWVAHVIGAPPSSARRHLAGASRRAWSVDVELDDRVVELFLLGDTGRGGGSARDAAVLRALAGTDVPVPVVHGSDDALRALLLERVPGRSDFPAVDDEAEREPTAADLMRVAAVLHRLEPSSLEIAHLGLPADGVDHAAAQLGSVEGVAALVGEGLHSLFPVALAWLRETCPDGGGRTALVHSDLGPGNFLAQGGRVTALLDWEVAHWGDPMEDLAALAVRDMATPVGDLATRYREYEQAGGPAVDVAVVEWYRILVLVRNSVYIGLGLDAGDDAGDRAELTMYRTLLMRAAALALCDAVGTARPVEPALEPSTPTDLVRLVVHARGDQDRVVEPAVDDPFARSRAAGVAGVLGVVGNRLLLGADRERRTVEDLRRVLGHDPADLDAGWDEAASLAGDPSRRAELVDLVARDLVREAMVLEPLLGDLYDRVPQRLEHP